VKPKETVAGNLSEDALGFAEAPSGYSVTDEGLPRIVAVIPALDEALSIAGVVETLRAQRTVSLHRIIVVDNGSSDGTGEIARRAGGIAATLGRASEVSRNRSVTAGTAASSTPT
jgi:cellulose synthase/poly-beta-1,6-N-acetylglucosamine synthase-like glycosyltransferase